MGAIASYLYVCSCANTLIGLQFPVSSCHQDNHTDPVKHWGVWALIRRYEPVLANPPGILQVGLYHAQGDGVGTRHPTWTTPISRHGQQFDIYFPNYYQVPVDVTAGWAASLVNTRLLYLYSWVDWKNVSKVSCSRKQQSVLSGNQTCNLSIS